MRSRKVQIITHLSAFLLLMALALIGATRAEASLYYYFEKPAEGASFTVGDEIDISFWAGVVQTHTSFDRGQPSTMTYQTMPATLKIYKGSDMLYSREFTYTKGTSLSTTYRAGKAGTLELRIYGKDRGLDVTEQSLQETMTIVVKEKQTTGDGTSSGTSQNGTPSVSSRKANTLIAKGRTVVLKYSNVKKRTQTIAVKKAIKVSKAHGTVTYAKKSGNKKIIINKKTGKITVKKGLRRGVYKVKVRVRAAGNKSYQAKAVTATVKIVIK